MGRRSIHTPDELRELIIQATTAIVEQDGLEGPRHARLPNASAIRPARSIMSSRTSTICCSSSKLGCSTNSPAGWPIPMLGAARGEVAPPRRHLFRFHARTSEAVDLLNEHRMPAGREVPEWYQSKVESLMTPLEQALAPLLPNSDPVAKSGTPVRYGQACTG